ncbi:MAG TPA: hypothetical protein V6C50_02510 [Crinalium sp.]
MVLTLSAGILFVVSYTESVFVLHPLIDTRLPQGFTQAGFDRIQPGMTKAEVLQLVPLPEPESLHMVSWDYGSDGACVFWDFAWFQLTIEFDQNGRVIKKTQRAFYD